MKYLLILTVLTLFNINSYANIYGPWKVGKSDSGIYGPTYQKIVEDLDILATKYSNFAEKVYIGESEDKQSIWGILLKNKNIPTKNLIYISGVTHGNEYLGIANNLPEKFLKNSNSNFYKYMNRGGAILIVPIANPYGYTARSRFNSNGLDLNRDFSNVITDKVRFTQSETRDLSKWIDKYLKETNAEFSLALDYHCCFNGSLLFPWGYTKTPLPTTDRNEFNQMGNLLKKYFPRSRFGETSEIIWYTADGTSMDYWYAKYGALGMTYEGRYKDENKNLDKHVKWWSDIVENF